MKRWMYLLNRYIHKVLWCCVVMFGGRRVLAHMVSIPSISTLYMNNNIADLKVEYLLDRKVGMPVK